MRITGTTRTAMLVAVAAALACGSTAIAKYTTKGQDIVDRATGERVILRGFGLGCWLLPEGYMWGIRKLDRPRQFEAAIVDLIGETNAADFWRLYYENYVTEQDVVAMKAWGANSLRIPLLASMLQPRDGQPAAAPYRYNEENFAYLDRLVDWCDRHDIGVIWDLHGAPGGQNAENISDSDGTARLWTEKQTYWPRCTDLWMKVVKRYDKRKCIIGYDLLNEPLLRRYDGIDPALLREFYVQLTRAIRTVDTEGIIFIEGDDWAQEFSMLEPLDWDPHLVIAFHSYPPTSSPEGLKRWDRLRQKYNIPLWHGETGEQGPPYAINRLSTTFLEKANVGWSWWTHKKFERVTQPWMCPKTPGFQRILDYWKGERPKPAPDEARFWLLEQARLTHSDHCVFIPEMVRSLHGLIPENHQPPGDAAAPRIIQSPRSATVEEGGAVELVALASGSGLTYTWLRDSRPIAGANNYWLKLNHLSLADDGTKLALQAANNHATAISEEATLHVRPYSGPQIPRASDAPTIDGQIDEFWRAAPRLPMDHVVLERGGKNEDRAAFRTLWDDTGLYLLVEVSDNAPYSGAELSYENDSVEIFFDCDNSKSALYGTGDFRFRCVVNSSEVQTLHGVAGGSATKPGVRVAQAATDGGYIMEFVFPWQALGNEARGGQYLGMDVHVNDNDGRGRVLKRAWHAHRDDAHLSPSRLGTVKLTEPK